MERLDQLTARAQELLAAGEPAEAAAALAEALALLDAGGGGDVEVRAELLRLLGNARWETGDVEASSAALEEGADLLGAVDRTPSGALSLAATWRSLLRNHRAAPTAAAPTPEEFAAALRPALSFSPQHAARLAAIAADDFAALGRADWAVPVAALSDAVARLDAVPALAIAYELVMFWRRRGNGEAAAEALVQGMERIEDLDAAAGRNGFSVLHNLGWAAVELDDDSAAARIAERLGAIEGSLGADAEFGRRRLAAAVRQRSGDLEGALTGMQAVLGLAQEAFGEDDARTRVARRGIAELLAASGRQEDSIDAYYELLRAEREAGQDPLTVADIASDLAGELDAASRYAEADEAHRLAFAYRARHLGPLHPDTNRSRMEVAEFSRILGREEEAEYYFLEAIDVSAQLPATPEERARAAQLRNNLADLYVSMGRHDEARPLLDEALDMRRELFGDDSERTWRTRMSLAGLEAAAGDPVRAVEVARAAIEREEWAGNAVWHIILANGLLRLRDFAAAEALYRRLTEPVGVEDIGRAVALDTYLELHRDLAICLLEREALAEAGALVHAVYSAVHAHFTGMVQGSSESQLARLVSRVIEVQSLVLSALADSEAPEPDHVAAAFNLANLVKGLRTRYLRWRQPGAANVALIAPPAQRQATRAIQDEIRTLVDELAADALAAGGHPDPVAARRSLGRRARLRELERALASAIGDSEMVVDQLPAAQARLPDGAMALEVVVARDVTAERLHGERGIGRYLAFVVGPGEDDALRLIDLGDADLLEEDVAGLRASLASEEGLGSGGEPLWRKKLRRLGREMLTRIEARLEAARHLLVAPDGALAAFPFELLIVPGKGYLVDQLDVSYLMRTGELEHRNLLARRGGPPLVLAGPDYDLTGAVVASRATEVGLEQAVAASLPPGTRFDPLPEAHHEGEAVGEHLGAEPLTGPWALGPELLAARSPEILHVATHGFSLPLNDALAGPLVLGATVGNPLDHRTVLEDPMQRSGLAFSGANAALAGRPLPPEAGSGLVFASDIQQLDLQQTDLAVLSACRSGLGDLELGDGAQGLRRALLAAGCRSVVSSLWDLPDESTRRLMDGFYERVLAGASRLEALSGARAEVRAIYPDSPLHWAGLVLDGDYGPLFRFSPAADLNVASVSLRAWGIGAEADESKLRALAAAIAGDADVDESDGAGPLTAATLRLVLAQDDLEPDMRIEALSMHADLASRIGDHERAVADFRTILAMDGLSPRARATYSYNLAKILHQVGDLEGAVEGYDGVLGGEPRPLVRWHTLVNRSAALLGLERFAEAAADATTVIEDPEAPPDQVYMARTNRASARSGTDPEGAREDLDAALAMGVADGFEELKVRVARAAVLVQVDPEAALRELGALEAHPRLPATWLPELANLRAQANRSL